MPVPGEGNYGINEPVMQEDMPIIKALAQMNLQLIDMHGALSGHEDCFPDRIRTTTGPTSWRGLPLRR
jgi:hypothetical protein